MLKWSDVSIRVFFLLNPQSHRQTASFVSLDGNEENDTSLGVYVMSRQVVVAEWRKCIRF